MATHVSIMNIIICSCFITQFSSGVENTHEDQIQNLQKLMHSQKSKFWNNLGIGAISHQSTTNSKHLEGKSVNDWNDHDLLNNAADEVSHGYNISKGTYNDLAKIFNDGEIANTNYRSNKHTEENKHRLVAISNNEKHYIVRPTSDGDVEKLPIWRNSTSPSTSDFNYDDGHLIKTGRKVAYFQHSETSLEDDETIKRRRQTFINNYANETSNSLEIPQNVGSEQPNIDLDTIKNKEFEGFTGPLYTKWSKWSRCTKHCEQTRRRRCRLSSLCGTALIKEKRPCVGWRCQHEKFQLIKPEEISHRFSNVDVDKARPAPRADVRVLHNYNSMFYTRWSEWDSCSRTCLTSRYRSCRYPLFCGSAVIREEAYCYTKDSACEKWYRRHKLSPNNKNVFQKPNGVINSNEVSFPNKRHPYFGAHNRSYFSSSNYVQNPPSRGQVIFGHNKFVTENLPVAPEVAANKFNFPTGHSNHRFALNPHSKKPMNNEVIAEKSTMDTTNANKNNYWLHRNNYKISREKENDVRSDNHLVAASTTSDSNFLKKPGYINNVFSQSYLGAELKDKETGSSKDVKHSSLPSSLSFGRPNSLPKECGISKIQKPLWSLRIIGGREAAPDKWPWQVAILNRFKEVFCGGTLVAPQWVVTAAHCLRKRLYVRLAEHDLAIKDGHELEFRITETVSHPLYDSTTVDNDVALLRLPEPVEVGDKMSPVCIPEQGTPLPVGKECTIIGWGKERNNHFFGTDVLNEAEVPIINEEMCRKVYDDYYITQNMFCAGYRKGRIDSCAGDSGGPLLCHVNGHWYIYGITSFGEGCGRRGKFGIYAKVSNYRTWINDVIAAHSHREQLPVNDDLKRPNRRHHRRHAKHRDFNKRTKSKHSGKNRLKTLEEE